MHRIKLYFAFSLLISLYFFSFTQSSEVKAAPCDPKTEVCS
mgnify:CR=1 FL=1